jgi:hypothetical protein
MFVTAAKEWRQASGIAAKTGDHKPAKDILLHAGVIMPRSTDGQFPGHGLREFQDASGDARFSPEVVRGGHSIGHGLTRPRNIDPVSD